MARFRSRDILRDLIECIYKDIHFVIFACFAFLIANLILIAHLHVSAFKELVEQIQIPRSNGHLDSFHV